MRLNTKLRLFKKTALFMVFLLVYQIVFPVAAYALTSGPTQPEFQAFEPVGTTEMVDLFTGDFTYNIPLFELPGPNGGYPFNLSYKPETGMDAESGPYGLGWTINPGVINRQMRGIPDDADGGKGDVVTNTLSIRDNWTVGGGMGGGIEAFGFGLSLGRSIYYNSYKGIGQKDNIGLSFHLSSKSGSSAGLGINLSTDSQNGVNISPNLSIEGKHKSGKAGASIGVNSRSGLTNLSLNANFSGNIGKKVKKGLRYNVSGGLSLSFTRPSIVPEVSMPWRGSNLDITFKGGGSFYGLYGNGHMKGFYSVQRLKNKGKPVSTPAYGYLNMHRALLDEETNVMLDFNRTKDGPISDNSLNLAVPNTTPDIYSLSGQGTGGMFRAYRSDMGILHDNEMKSKIMGGAYSADLLFMHGGAQLSGNYSESSSGKWKEENKMLEDLSDPNDENYDFHGEQGSDYEPAYFKIAGEKVSEGVSQMNTVLGGTEPMRIEVEDLGAISNFEKRKYTSIATQPAQNRTDRKPRNSGIIQLKNEELKTSDAIKEFDLKYYGRNDDDFTIEPEEDFKDHRQDNHHIGAFINYDPTGLRYNYGIPAYNHVHRERLFSVEGVNGCGPNITDVPLKDGEVKYQLAGTDKFFSKTELPPYAHAYLLTSVLGADYVDSDDTPGPSEGDQGYWIKFSYQKQHDDFKWRAPYSGYNFNEGLEAKSEDDKGSFLYGEKEIWQLARAESKTHVAIFNLEDRDDARGAKGEFEDYGSGAGSQVLEKVKNIKLFTRNEINTANQPQPIKTIHFNYDYNLCNGVENNINGGGKLTLKELWFTHNNSKRGELGKYKFTYGEVNGTVTPKNYELNRYDRWGNFKGLTNSNDQCENIDQPYTRQFNPSNTVTKEEFEQDIVRDLSAWSLSGIQLPSGANIDVKWEPKSYSHVQNRVATQMFKIVSTKPMAKNSYGAGSYSDCAVDYFPKDDHLNLPTLKLYERSIIRDLEDEERRIYFELEHPIEKINGLPAEGEIDKYFEDLHLSENGNKQLYFRIQNRLKHSVKNVYENTNGYAEIKDFGVDETSDKCPGNDYRWGYITLAKPMIGGTEKGKFHPFSLATWQFMKSEIPELTFGVGPISPDAPANRNIAKQVLSSALGSINEIQSMFAGYYNYCKKKGFGQYIQQSHSLIKLNSPDKKKYGGGLRVKSVVMDDNWSNGSFENQPTYGQVYHYEGGVAAFEPSIGGDENALRHARNYEKNIKLGTNSNLFTEYPINENYFPAPVIGHSKVIVTSLATHLAGLTETERADQFLIASGSLPDGFATTGKVEHEFYTAKEFPVITDQTEINKDEDNNKQKKVIPYFPFGQTVKEKNTIAQGYSVELNDMHGKPKKVSHFGQDIEGNFSTQPESWVQYNYQYNELVKEGRKINKLSSTVEVLNSATPNTSGNLPHGPKEIGVDYEVFNDMREFKSYSWDVGGQFNIDGVIIVWPIPIPTYWPDVSHHYTQMRTAVTNKIISRTGIMTSMEAFENGSYVRTDNLLFDGQTGQPVLTSVNNSYKTASNKDKIYNLNIPGHMVYDGMGPAYKNLGIEFNASRTTAPGGGCGGASPFAIPLDIVPHLLEGDEFVASYIDPNGGNRIYGKATLLSTPDAGGLAFMHLEPGSIEPDYQFKLVRSARRNHLSAAVGSIASLNHNLTKGWTNGGKCDYQVYDVNINSSTTTNTDYIVILEFWDYILSNDLLSQININTPLNLANSNNSVLYNAYQASGLANLNITHLHLWPSGNKNSFKFGNSTNPTPCPSNLLVSHCCWLTFKKQNGDFYFEDLKEVTNINVSSFDPLTRNVEIEITSNGTTFSEIVEVQEIKTICGAIKNTIIQEEIVLNTINNSFLKTIHDNILSTSATTYKDVWNAEINYMEDEAVTTDPNQPTKPILGKGHTIVNPYKTGKKGIWRPHKSFAYVDERKQVGDDSNTGINYIMTDTNYEPSTQSDGTFDALPLFDYHNPFFDKCTNWVMTNEMTKYGGSNELENRNILDQYSSALYGHYDNLAIAVGSNSRHSELGFESFEEFPTGGNTNLQIMANLLQDDFSFGNIDFLPLPSSTTLPPSVPKQKVIFDSYEIITGKGQDIVVVNKPYHPNWDPAKIRLFTQPTLPIGSETEMVSAEIIDMLPVQGHPEYTGFRIEFDAGCGANYDLNDLWVGTASFPTIYTAADNPIGASIPTNETIVNSRAHTGKQCLKVAAPGNVFRLRTLDLIPGKEYVASMWISKEDRTQPTFSKGNAIWMSSIYHTLEAAGEVIDGWQKWETKFTAGTSNDLTVLLNEDLYLDDVRIFPADGNMQSYVYDPDNYRLKATLDNNNYATLYNYDEEGNVKVIKKETERGIVTIQENASYIKGTQ